MNQGSTGNQAVERLKSVFMLGLTSNLTTFAGLVLVWITLTRQDLVSGFLTTLLTVLAFTPVFMADAINHYCLGRIRLEHRKGWDDVQITPKGRSFIAHNYHLFRVASIIPAFLLAAVMVSSFGLGGETLKMQLRMAFLAAFILHFLRSTWFLHSCVAPRLPGFGGRKLVLRTLVAAAVFAGWYIYFSGRISDPAALRLEKSAILLHGIFYFFLNAFMHPLPTRYSLLRPGKTARREAFFTIEMLDEEQFNELGNSAQIADTAAKFCSRLNFTAIGNIRLPLIELPLFQAWGRIFTAADRKSALLVFDSEVGRGVHCSLISFKGERVFISTDFGTPQAKFPANITYQNLKSPLEPDALLQKHAALLSDIEPELIDGSVAARLEALVRSVVKFLEKDAAANRIKPENNGDNNYEPDRKPE